MADFYEDTTPDVETKGTFVPGGAALFFFSFPDINGELFDPVSISVSIYDSSNTVVVEGEETQKIETGQYVYSWDIPSGITPGLFRIEVTFTVEGGSEAVETVFGETFTVTGATTDDTYLNSQLLAARAALEAWIGYTQRIPVFNETGRFDKDRTVVEFTFPRWNQPAGAKVYVNGARTSFPHEIDFMRGRITFTNALSQYDHVTADYNFRWFKDEELDLFMSQAIDVFNQYPPHTSYSLWNVPRRYGVTVLDQAAVFALRRLMMDLSYQEPAKIYGGMDRADKVMGQLNTLKENYENELNKMYEQKKYFPYAGLTRTIVVPEFTLPGGRSRWFRYLFKGA